MEMKHLCAKSCAPSPPEGQKLHILPLCRYRIVRPEFKSDYPVRLAVRPESKSDYPECLAVRPESKSDYPVCLAVRPEFKSDYPARLAVRPEFKSDYPVCLAVRLELGSDYCVSYRAGSCLIPTQSHHYRGRFGRRECR